MTLSLQLRYDPSADAPAEAWFLQGDSIPNWIEELARCGLATMETRLFIVPHSIENRRPAGLLVLPARPDASVSPSGIPCCSVAGRLFIPVDATLYPAITDVEARRVFNLPICFFHPVFGLSGFESESALRVSDLLGLPAEADFNWNFARAGAAALPQLVSIVLLQPPSIDDVFGEAPEEIGTESPKDLPPAPDEPTEDAVAKTRRGLRKLLARGISEVTGRMPHTGSRRTWINSIEDWANRQLRGVNEQLDRLRNKELHRLLQLLDKDPEAGLRHAIPMNQFAHRGTAPPGGRLGSHSIDFNPGKLGGGPADFWHVPADLENILRRRYREMADREMQLGRHRRAAYIYAELLGDLVSAANALRQGKLYREAALLYEDYLKNPLEAARCLAEGGLLAEAIERYEKLNRWLDVADLHERAGDFAAAERAIRRVVNDRLEQQDILGAAKLIEERLRAPDEALELLLQAWPSSYQAAACLAGAFRILGQLGRHEAALERLAGLNRETVPYSLVLPLVATLTGQVREYPNELFRHRAADLSRVLIARQLQSPAVTTDQTGRLLEHLVRLAPQDRLLSRDANRSAAERRSARLRATPATPPPIPGKKPIIYRRFDLPRQIEWLQLRRESNWFYALGITAKRLTVLRGSWEGAYQSLSWDCPAQAVKQGFVFEPTHERGSMVVLARADGPPLAEKRFPAADTFFDKVCTAGTPEWLPEGFPFAFGDGVVWTVHVAAGRAVLSCYDRVQGHLRQTADITSELLEGANRTEETRLSLTNLGRGVAIALGNRLVVKDGGGGFIRVELPGQVVRIFSTIPHTREGVAVMLHHGAAMYWVGSGSCSELDRDIASPIGAFVPNGPLVLASESHLLLLEAGSRGVQSVVRMELDGQRIVGVSPASEAGEFAVLAQSGQMTIYRMPR